MHDPEFDAYSAPKTPWKEKKRWTRGTTPPAEGNPWLTSWTTPRGTIRAIVESGPGGTVLVLAMFMGIDSLMGSTFRTTPGGVASLPAVLRVVVLGSMLGVVANFVCGSLMRWTGSWLGGRATAAECRAALAWASVPTVVEVTMLLPFIVLTRVNPFQPSDPGPVDDPTSVALLLTLLIRLILSIWTIVLTIKTVAEVHQFSSWASIAVCILTSVLFVGGAFATIAAAFSAYQSVKGFFL